MGIATGLTAERMLEIERKSIVNGAVDLVGHLILTNFGGEQIDAGLVVDSASIKVTDWNNAIESATYFSDANALNAPGLAADGKVVGRNTLADGVAFQEAYRVGKPGDIWNRSYTASGSYTPWISSKANEIEDWNQALDPGSYYSTPSAANAPGGPPTAPIVGRTLIARIGTTILRMQEAYRISEPDRLWTRSQSSGIFTAWSSETNARTRLTSTAEASLMSTEHPYQHGPTNGLNLAMGGSKIQLRNNGAASRLNIQTDGGGVNLGANGSPTELRGAVSIPDIDRLENIMGRFVTTNAAGRAYFGTGSRATNDRPSYLGMSPGSGSDDSNQSAFWFHHDGVELFRIRKDGRIEFGPGGYLNVAALPFAMAAGRSNVDISYPYVSFPSGRFTQAPVVVSQLDSGAGADIGVSTMVTQVTATNFRLRHSGASGSRAVYWAAIQMTPSAGAG